MNSATASAHLNAAIWAEFASASTREEILGSWLAILCTQIDGVTGGLLLIASDQANTFTAGAVWPDPYRDMAYLAPIAQQALGERRGIVLPYAKTGEASAASGAYVAYPVEVAGELKGAIVLDTAPRPEAQLQHALRLIHWAQAWLVDLFRQQLLQERDRTLARMALVNGVVATALQERRFKPSALAVVNELATRLACDRVSLGLDDEGSARIEVISHTATFDPKANLSRLIADVMDEALDLGAPVVHPAEGDERFTSTAHAALAEEAGAIGVLSVPLVDDGRNIGVLSFERHAGAAFDAATIETCKVLGLLLGPIFALERHDERGAALRLWDASRSGVQALFGPHHGGAKLLAVLGGALLLFLAFATGDYRVAAKTVVEGAMQRATAAPFEGFIAESFVRAGDTVKRGQPMARLDDKDLRVELSKWSAEREQYLRKYRQALAGHDRAAMNVLGAQASQAEAQQALVEERLERVQLLAPFDGVVVSGDLRQLLGTPVEQGKVLFETAPLNAFRVILQVDEREIAHVAVGQTGQLALSGMPGERLSFTVKQITPVATAEDGKNFFRVEAQMESGIARLRPGMEGIGKVEVGPRRLIWIWTHGLTDWLRISLWSWLP